MSIEDYDHMGHHTGKVGAWASGPTISKAEIRLETRGNHGV